MLKSSHAYAHLIGTQVGVDLGRVYGAGRERLIVLATVVRPGEFQDDNYIRVILENGIELYVKYMDTYRADFVTGDANMSVSGSQVDA